MEARAEHQTEKRFQMLYWGTVTLGAVVSGLVVFWTLCYRGGFGWSDVNIKFNWHPVLMTIGMIFMFGNGLYNFQLFSLKKTPTPHLQTFFKDKTRLKVHFAVWFSCFLTKMTPEIRYFKSSFLTWNKIPYFCVVKGFFIQTKKVPGNPTQITTICRNNQLAKYDFVLLYGGL